MIKPNYQETCANLLAFLPKKQKEIINRRFGLETGKRETLAKIGEDFGISRERVRQIENNGLKKLVKIKKEREVQKIFNFLNRYLEKQGGLKREDLLLSELSGERNQDQNTIYFFLVLGDPFYYFRENENFYSFWSKGEIFFKRAEKILNNLLSVFEKENRPLSREEFFELINKKENPKNFLSYFEIFRAIEESPLGEFGLIKWPEIKPRRVKDKVYLIFKKTGQPIHFSKVAELINELQAPICWPQKILTQTIHNELIKDERFVLIGKGTYALREWGYKPGLVKDIIIDILKSANQPLTKEEIIQAIASQRQVKENTILINLHNRDLFVKDEEGRYRIKEI